MVGAEQHTFCLFPVFERQPKRVTPLTLLVFKAMRILVLKFLNFRNPKACRLISLMSLLVASSFALE